MAKKAKQDQQSPATDAVQAVPVSIPRSKRLPLAAAQAHNRAFTFVDAASVSAADVALTSKGTNPKKARVYGYDNLSDGGGVPKDKRIVLVPGVTGTPKGVAAEQWDALVALLGGSDTVTAATARDSVSSRTIRRAYRAGAIRFAL